MSSKVDRKYKHRSGKKKCLLNPKATYVFSPLTPLGDLGCTRNKYSYFFIFLGGLLGDFITPWDDLNSNVMMEYKYREVNRKTPLLEVKSCYSWLSPKELYTFGKWRWRFGSPFSPSCVAIFSFIYKFGPHVLCVYQGRPLVNPCTS